MYICYYDESGDDGYPKYSSQLFVLTGLYFQHKVWKDFYCEVQDFRKYLKDQYNFPIKLELHTKHFLLNKKPYRKFNWTEDVRLKIIDEFCELISRLEVKIVNVVINKEPIISNSFKVLETALKYSVQRIENDLIKNDQSKKFLILTDEGRVGKMRNTTRKIQKINFIPSQFSSSMYRKEIQLLIEDPLEKKSSESYFIQLSDLVAYIVYLYSGNSLEIGEMHNRIPEAVDSEKIKSWMDLLKPSLNTQASSYNDYGIVIHPR